MHFFRKRLEKGPTSLAHTVGIKSRLEVVVIIYNLSAGYLIPTVNYGPFYPSEADGWERLLRGMTF